ncbi:MAG: hypothetical protein KDI71_11365 [Xanthomonadales bacterium]|nr:hypothetical protein [Xanthomonadales bacterium]
MRAAPLRWVLWIFVGIVAYGLYQRITVQPMSAAAPISDRDDRLAQAEARVARLEQDAAQADATIDQAIARNQQYEARQRGRAVFASEFGPVTMLRVAMAECYYSDGRWPVDGCGVHLEDFQGELLQSVQIGEQGRIQMHFGEGLGLPAIDLTLVPVVNTVGIKWRCSSANYPQIRTLLHDCAYEPAG